MNRLLTASEMCEQMLEAVRDLNKKHGLSEVDGLFLVALAVGSCVAKPEGFDERMKALGLDK